MPGRSNDRRIAAPTASPLSKAALAAVAALFLGSLAGPALAHDHRDRDGHRHGRSHRGWDDGRRHERRHWAPPPRVIYRAPPPVVYYAPPPPVYYAPPPPVFYAPPVYSRGGVSIQIPFP
jgi:hypothetical protein